MKKFNIDFQPIGKRVVVSEDMHLLAAAQAAGVALSAVCGGVGTCQDCRIRIISGEVSEIQPFEREAFTISELSAGWRLACQVFPRSNLIIDVPPESLRTTQRLQIEGVVREVPLAPAVYARDFSIDPPDQDDLRADWERLTEVLGGSFPAKQDIPLPVLSQFSTNMRKWGWSGRMVLGKDHQPVGCLEVHQPYYGLAVDIGTTKVAAFLVDLTNGKVLVKKGMMNPQIAYGEDVVNRIAYANQGSSQRQTLQRCLVDGLSELSKDLCERAAIRRTQIVDFVVVGNTTMHHLFAGLAVRQLGQAPYVAAVQQAIHFPAREIGLSGAPGACVYLPPNVAGYVGADHIAMLLAADLPSKPGVTLALDIGTNTEVSLSKEGRLTSCSCASGPAFEGAHIHAGMRAVPGAIERAQFNGGEWHVSTIDDEPPVGICGSGILDVVAELLKSGQIDTSGRFTDKLFRRVERDRGGGFVLVPCAESGTGEDILVERADIREIQLAKAAIRAGVEALLRATSTDVEEIDHFIVAGAFGTYLHIDSAIRIGMFPALPRKKFTQIGNAAGAGAQQMLISQPGRLEAEAIIQRMSYLELTTDPGFNESYIDSMLFQ
ncbi:MAG: ASKHA domain-containing protein [Chloroflexota bacterium]|nr:ASKHA domain-containing protein [Chloroflexota bacterium]